MTATCLSSALGREVVNLSSAQITESIQEHLPWFEDFSWCLFVFLWNQSILSPERLFPKTIKKEIFQCSVLFILFYFILTVSKLWQKKKSLNYVLLELRIKTQRFLIRLSSWLGLHASPPSSRLSLWWSGGADEAIAALFSSSSICPGPGGDHSSQKHVAWKKNISCFLHKGRIENWQNNLLHPNR